MGIVFLLELDPWTAGGLVHRTIPEPQSEKKWLRAHGHTDPRFLFFRTGFVPKRPPAVNVIVSRGLRETGSDLNN
jgi:hypothetical protein